MKRVNLQVLIELLCFLLFDGLLVYLVISGQYVNLVNPRLLPFIWITIVLIFLWSINRVRYLKRRTHRSHLTHCFSILLPFFLFVIPLGTLKSSTLPNDYVDSSQIAEYVQISKSSGENEVIQEENQTNSQSESNQSSTKEDHSVSQENPSKENADSSANDTSDSSGSNDGQVENKLADNERLNAPFIIDGLDDVNQVITVNPDYFLPWLSELSSNLDYYIGYTVKITGFVYENDTMMEANDFSVSRMLMSCCTADLTPIGLLATHELDRNILVDQWYTFEGKIETKEFMGKTVAYLKVSQANRVSKPEVEFVYP